MSVLYLWATFSLCPCGITAMFWWDAIASAGVTSLLRLCDIIVSVCDITAVSMGGGLRGAGVGL